MKNPYDTIGVPPDATPEQVKAAYRQTVKKAHPDAGGTGEQFREVQKAWLVLSDPARRRKYDQTGVVDDDRPTDQVSRAMTDAIKLVSSMLGQAAAGFDVVELAVEQAKRHRETDRKNAQVTRQRLAIALDMAAKIRRKGGNETENHISTALRNMAEQGKLEVAAHEASCEHWQAVIEVLQGYEWTGQKPDPWSARPINRNFPFTMP